MITAWIFQYFLSIAGMRGSHLFSSWKCYRNGKVPGFVCFVVFCLCLVGALVRQPCTSLGSTKVIENEFQQLPQDLPSNEQAPPSSGLHFHVVLLSIMSSGSWAGKGDREEEKVGFCRHPLMRCDFKGFCLFWISLHWPIKNTKALRCHSPIIPLWEYI